MEAQAVRGAVIGFDDQGRPIVTEDYGCPRWAGSGGGLSVVRECWYCWYADFRKRTDVTLSQSVCRCPENRAADQGDCGGATHEGGIQYG